METNSEQIDTTAEAADIMRQFAALTGISPAHKSPQRYLWTDAFAVCNLLELFCRTGDKEWLNLTLRLVDQVHHVLGQHRSDDSRSGWISGMNETEGENHPTRGGLRIGKRLNERRLRETSDERLEWDQDGQYFHYLTKWMHALARVSRVTKDPKYLAWGIELAQAAHAAFTVPHPRGGIKRMYWKMSIDLTRTLVPSMGQHDPLDGYVTYAELQATARELALSPEPALSTAMTDMEELCRGMVLETDDSLGIGGLLCDAWRIAQLTDRGMAKGTALLERVASAALAGLKVFELGAPVKLPAAYRLAFRELGLTIGLKGVVPLRNWSEKHLLTLAANGAHRNIEELTGYLPLAGEIERFWLKESNRTAGTWREHREINMVMLATSLVPDQFLSI